MIYCLDAKEVINLLQVTSLYSHMTQVWDANRGNFGECRVSFSVKIARSAMSNDDLYRQAYPAAVNVFMSSIPHKVGTHHCNGVFDWQLPQSCTINCLELLPAQLGLHPQLAFLTSLVTAVQLHKQPPSQG